MYKKCLPSFCARYFTIKCIEQRIECVLYNLFSFFRSTKKCNFKNLNQYDRVKENKIFNQTDVHNKSVDSPSQFV